jgi:hypothetical protein
MIKKFSILLCLLVTSKLVWAESTNQTMTKVVYRDILTNLLSSSFAAQPITLYRFGKKYGRIEEAPDSVLKIHGLIIVDEPDAWMINLITKTGVHMVDSGPTYEFHDLIVSPHAKTQAEFRTFTSLPINKFQFGKEVEFLKTYKAEKLSDHYELIIDGYTIELFPKAGTEIPYQLKIFKGEPLISYLQYDEYKTDLPLDLSLFAPPPGIKISEQSH